jgi:RecG-like helicase
MDVLLFKCNEEETDQTRLKVMKEHKLGVIGSNDRLKKRAEGQGRKGQRTGEKKGGLSYLCLCLYRLQVQDLPHL